MKPKLIIQVPADIEPHDRKRIFDEAQQAFPDTKIAMLAEPLKGQWGTPYAAMFKKITVDPGVQETLEVSIGCQTAAELSDLLDQVRGYSF